MQPLLDSLQGSPAHFPRACGTRRGAGGAVVGHSGLCSCCLAQMAVLCGRFDISILFLARGTGRLHEFAVRPRWARAGR